MSLEIDQDHSNYYNTNNPSPVGNHLQLMRTEYRSTDRERVSDPTQCSFENLQRKTGRGLSPGMNEGNVYDGGASRCLLSASALRGGFESWELFKKRELRVGLCFMLWCTRLVKHW